MRIFLAIPYIKRKAKHHDILLPHDYIKTLDGYQKYSNYKIYFIGNFAYKNNKLRASASFPNYIIFSSEWSYQLLVNNSDELQNAFIETLGHEEAHKEKELHASSKASEKEKIFCKKVNEVHCDFRGTQKKLNSNRQLLIQALKFKYHFNNEPDKYSKTHPRWCERIDYATNYNFDEKLIRRVALDNSFTDEDVIMKASTHFDNIILR